VTRPEVAERAALEIPELAGGSGAAAMALAAAASAEHIEERSPKKSTSLRRGSR